MHRDVEAGSGSQPPAHFLIDLEILDHRVDALASPAVENASGLRALPLETHPGELLPTLAVGCAHHEIAFVIRNRDQDEARLDELAQAGRHEVQEPGEIRLRDERVRDLVQRLELLQPARRRLVEPRVLDRDRGLGREQRRQLFVFVGERNASVLLGEVEVSVGDAAQEDRDAEERSHRRMVRGEADRARILRKVVEAQRLRVLDQRAEDPAATRKVADRGLRLRIDARDDELLERLAAGVDDAQRRIAGSGQLGGRLDDSLEDGVERQLGRERDTRVDDGSQTIHLGHAG